MKFVSLVVRVLASHKLSIDQRREPRIGDSQTRDSSLHAHECCEAQIGRDRVTDALFRVKKRPRPEFDPMLQ